jgi:hypothetical protein
MLMGASVWIVNLAVLIAVLEADLGHRKITWFRIARPLLLSAVIIPVYIKHASSSGSGLAIEVAGAAVGILFGLTAGVVMKVHRDPATGRAVSFAGMGYAALWITAIGARLFFVYGANHIFDRQLGHWLVNQHISSDALTDGLIFMAVTMTLSRTATLVGRAVTAKPAAVAPAGSLAAAS